MKLNGKTVYIYDKPSCFDRYTVVIGNDFFGMSENATGFNQYCGSKCDGYKRGRHLGKFLNHIPEGIKQAIINRIE